MSPPKWTLCAGGVEQPDLVDAALARQNPLPEIFDLATQRGDGAQSGYDDASFHEMLLQDWEFSMYWTACPTV